MQTYRFDSENVSVRELVPMLTEPVETVISVQFFVCMFLFLYQITVHEDKHWCHIGLAYDNAAIPGLVDNYMSETDVAA